MSPEWLSGVGWLPEPGGDVGWCNEGFDRDRGDEGGGDRVGADPGIDGQWPEYGGVGAQQDAVEVRRDDVAGDQGQAQARARLRADGPCSVRTDSRGWNPAREQAPSRMSDRPLRVV